MLAVFIGPQRGLPVLPRAAGDENVLRVAYTQKLQPDPHQRTFPIPAQNQFILSLWEPLIECDPATGQPRPAAAESWSWSDDRLKLTVKLRPDGHWSNGDPVTTRDFVRGWRRLLHQKIDTASVLFPLKNAEALHGGKMQGDENLGVEAVDDRILRISLTAPRSTFVAELADPLFSPVHESTEAVLREQAYWLHPEKLVSNGAFQLEQARADGYRLRTCPHYRDRVETKLAGVDFIRVANMSMARLMAAAGQVDVLASPGGNPTKLPTNRGLREESELALTVSTLDLNVTRGPLRDLRVRRALSLALNRSGSIEPQDSEKFVPALAWVPDMPGRPGLTLLREDVAEARRLLAEAGYPSGRGFPVLIMPVASSGWTSYAYLQAWTECWYRELGVRTYLAYEMEAERKQRMDSGDYDVSPNSLVATVPDAGDMLGIFALPRVYNATRWEKPEFNQLLAKADRKTGVERLALLEQAERIVMSEVPTIPMMFEQRRTLLAVEVAGWYADPLGRQLLKHLSIQSMPVENSTARRSL